MKLERGWEDQLNPNGPNRRFGKDFAEGVAQEEHIFNKDLSV